jgi:energy-coupling factor transport system ATP-binding protein
MIDSEAIVTLRDVSYCHVGKNEPALRNINLDIQRGTITIIVGPSGSGKTTLCDILAGSIPHLYGGDISGEIIIGGLNTNEHDVVEIARKAGKVFQDPEVMFSMLEVEDEIGFGPENLGFSTESIRATVEDCLDYVGLQELRHNLVWELSGGQVQKLGLACILAMNTPIIVLDEPTANLDPLSTKNVHALILKLKEKGITVVLVTKELDEFLALADQVAVLDKGKLLFAGPPQDIVDQHGDFLADELGVWLPEVCELGLALRKMNLIKVDHLPMTVKETLPLLMAGEIRFSPEMPGQPSTAAQNGVETTSKDRSVLISAENLSYAYQERREALKGVSFEVRRGDLLAIIGRNGAGKSTLSKLLVGLLKPTGGKLQLFGKEAGRWEIPQLARKIALVFQNPEHQFLTDTVYDEIAYSFYSRGEEDSEELRKSVNRILTMLDLQDVVADHPFALSAGKKRRLGVAAMLVGSPEVLVVDEPTYGQDKAMTNSLMKLIMQLRTMGITIIMITHSMRLVEEYADRTIVMNEGRITFDGQVKELFRHTSILNEASLTVTTLQELMDELARQNKPVNGNVRSVQDFLGVIAR